MQYTASEYLKRLELSASIRKHMAARESRLAELERSREAMLAIVRRLEQARQEAQEARVIRETSPHLS
jgi:hypothetical protein